MAEIEYIEIDPVKRKILSPEDMLLGVMEDANVERKYFKCPKIVGDNVDLSQHQIYVKYIQATDKTGTKFKEEEPGFWHCEDVSDEGDYITFSWRLTGNVFVEKGFIAFSVVASDGDEVRWNTYPAVGTVLLTIPGGLEMVAERYPDIISQLLKRMDAVEAIATPEAMQNYVEAYFTENPPSGSGSAIVSENPLNGKYLSILADSISTYPGYIPEGYSCYYATNLMNSVEYMWWHRLMTATGMKLCVNNAYSGSCVAVVSGVADGYSGCNTVRNMRLHTDTNVPDVIVIQIGTNDYVHGVPIGTYNLSDGEMFDESTFMGAYAKMLWNINDKYPNTKVYCGTIPKFRNDRDEDYPVSGLDAYNEAIRKVSDMFGADIVDFSSCGITSANVPNYTVDGRIHPNKDGQALMANKAIEDIQPFNTIRYDVLSPIINSDATLDDGDEGGSGGAGDTDDGNEENTDTPETTLLARYDFTGGNSNDLVGTMNGTDTNITYTSAGAIFAAKSIIDFGQYDLTQKTVELDIGEVTGASGYVFVPNNFNSSLYKGLTFDSVWKFFDSANGTNTSENSDVQSIANKTIRFVYSTAKSNYISCSIYFGDALMFELEKASFTGGYLYLGNGSSTIAMTIKEMRIYDTV